MTALRACEERLGERDSEEVGTQHTPRTHPLSPILFAAPVRLVSGSGDLLGWAFLITEHVACDGVYRKRQVVSNPSEQPYLEVQFGLYLPDSILELDLAESYLADFLVEFVLEKRSRQFLGSLCASNQDEVRESFASKRDSVAASNITIMESGSILPCHAFHDMYLTVALNQREVRSPASR